MSMNVKSASPPFIFFVKKCDLPPGSSKIYSDPPHCCVKFILTLPFWAGKKFMILPWIPPAHPSLLKNECSQRTVSITLWTDKCKLPFHCCKITWSSVSTIQLCSRSIRGRPRLYRSLCKKKGKKKNLTAVIFEKMFGTIVWECFVLHSLSVSLLFPYYIVETPTKCWL